MSIFSSGSWETPKFPNQPPQFFTFFLVCTSVYIGVHDTSKQLLTLMMLNFRTLLSNNKEQKPSCIGLSDDTVDSPVVTINRITSFDSPPKQQHNTNETSAQALAGDFSISSQKTLSTYPGLSQATHVSAISLSNLSQELKKVLALIANQLEN